MTMRRRIGSTSGTLRFVRTPNWVAATACLTPSRSITSAQSRQCSTITSNNMPSRYKQVCVSLRQTVLPPTTVRSGLWLYSCARVELSKQVANQQLFDARRFLKQRILDDRDD